MGSRYTLDELLAALIVSDVMKRRSTGYVWMYGVKAKCMHEGTQYTHTHEVQGSKSAERSRTYGLHAPTCSESCIMHWNADSIIAGVTQLKEKWLRNANAVRSANGCFC